MSSSNIFHAYDVRGVYPTEIDEVKVKRIAMAYATFLRQGHQPSAVSNQPLVVAVGCDVRLSSPKLKKAVIEGLTEAGVSVIDIGSVPTDMLYFAVGYYHYDGGIQVTASHNPAEFNGLKMVRGGVEAISGESGLKEIQRLVESDANLMAMVAGEVETDVVEEAYFDFLTHFVHFDAGQTKKIVANNNFGLSGPVAKRLLTRLSSSHINLIELNWQADGNFPKGRPDPLRAENRQETSELILETKADFGVAWDADGDRFFLYDEEGQFVEGCYLTAILAKSLLEQNPREKIIYGPFNIWAVEAAIESAGGKKIMERVGHSFIKSRMKKEGALFAGESSGHYFFRDFYSADNGLIPFLLVLNILTASSKKVSELLAPYRENYPVSGEINFEVANKDKLLKQIESKYTTGTVDRTDGLSVSFDNWRFNVRPSNTENLLRLNVEARDRQTCDQKTAELEALINGLSHK